METVSSQNIDDDLVRYVLGHSGQKPAGDGKGVTIIAYYAGQLIQQISLGPLAPRQIVVTGRMASLPVLNAIRSNLLLWTNGYPRRRQFTAAGIADHIIPSETSEAESPSELRGCEVLALSLARSGWSKDIDTVSIDNVVNLRRTS